MKREAFNSWLENRVDTQTKLTIGACAGMAALAALLFLIKGGILYLLLSVAYGSGLMAATVVLLLVGGASMFVWKTAPSQLTDSEHEVHTGFRTMKLQLAPTLAHCWTFAMGSLESDQSFIMRIVSLFMLIPRLSWTSWYVFGRIEQTKQIDIEMCGKVIRMALKKSERVEVEEVAEKFKSMDIPVTLRQLSLIDGIVFLTKDGVGISIANRFKDDLEAGLLQDDPTVSRPDTPFA